MKINILKFSNNKFHIDNGLIKNNRIITNSLKRTISNNLHSKFDKNSLSFHINITKPKLKIYSKNFNLLKSSSFNIHNSIEGLKYNIFIKENSRLEDLTYKEEIFEYVALKSNVMSEKDIILALEKLENHVILETELKEFKFFIRNILEIQSNFNSEYAITKFLKYFITTYNRDLKKFFDSNYISVENNKYDLYFQNIYAALLNFALMNIMKIEINFNLKYYLDLFLLINFTNDKIKKEFLEKIQIKFLQNINLNLANSPFNLNNIIEKSELDDVKDKKEEDLLSFLLINISLNKYIFDEYLCEIINYFDLRLRDKYGLIKYWNSEFNIRPKIYKLENRELKILNIIYGILNNWIEIYKKEIEGKKDPKEINDDVHQKSGKSNNTDQNIKKDNSIEINLIKNKEHLDIIQNFLNTVEIIIFRNNKISKAKFLKIYKDESIRLRDTINLIEESNKMFINKVLSEMEKDFP